MYSYGPPHMAVQKQNDQLELTYSYYVRTQDVTLKTCRRRWMIGRSGERGSGISVLAARHDDEDIYIYIYIYIPIQFSCYPGGWEFRIYPLLFKRYAHCSLNDSPGIWYRDGIYIYIYISSYGISCIETSVMVN